MSGGLVTALCLVFVLVYLEKPSGGTGSIKTADSLPSAPKGKAGGPEGRDRETPSLPLTFYETLTRINPEQGSPEGFSPESFKPLAPPKTLPEWPPPSGEGYIIQVAALANQDTAEKLAQRLRRKGFSSRILPLSVPNRGMLFRVRIEGFRSLEEAEKWAAHLKQEEGLSPFIAKEKS